ncbi:hypothetical protein HQ535_02010 [bacterium]|nr:hypothetical protein [bacterium]
MHAQNRTPTAAAVYLIRRFGMSAEAALAEIEAVLGNGPSNRVFQAALQRIR